MDSNDDYNYESILELLNLEFKGLCEGKFRGLPKDIEPHLKKSYLQNLIHLINDNDDRISEMKKDLNELPKRNKHLKQLLKKYNREFGMYCDGNEVG